MSMPSDTAPRSKESQAIYLLMIAVLAMVNLPYLWGMTIQHEEFVFSGFVYEFTFYDALSYIAKMRPEWTGTWLYQNPYATEAHKPVLLFVLYSAMGRLASVLGVSLIAMYHAARVGFSILLLFAADRVIKTLEFRGASRVLAFVFVFTAAGFGWVLRRVRTGDFPLDYFLTEASAFLSMVNYPHFVLSSALILFSIAEFYRCARGEASWWSVPLLATMAFVQAWVHPRLVLTILAVGGIAALWGAMLKLWPARRWVLPLGATLAAALPPMAATMISVRADPIWFTWVDPYLPSYSPLEYFFMYGLLWPFAIYGAWKAARSRSARGVFLVSWLVVACVLPYLPMNAQRRMTHGWNFPLALLAAYALAEHIIPALVQRWRLGERAATAIAVVVAVVMALSPLDYIYYGARKVVRGQFPAYYSVNRQEMMAWLDANTTSDDVVMGSFMTGMFIPAMSGNRVVLGHWAETTESKQKDKEIGTFFSIGMSMEERLAYLDEHEVDYVVFGQWESQPGGFDPATEPEHFRKVWESPTIVVYEYRSS